MGLWGFGVSETFGLLGKTFYNDRLSQSCYCTICRQGNYDCAGDERIFVDRLQCIAPLLRLSSVGSALDHIFVFVHIICLNIHKSIKNNPAAIEFYRN